MEFLGHMVTFSYVFWGNTMVFLAMYLHYFTFLPAMCDGSSVNLYILYVLITVYKVMFYCNFICISLIVIEVDPLFIFIGHFLSWTNVKFFAIIVVKT